MARLAHPLRADKARRPVLLRQALDAHDAFLAWGVHELVAADHDADVRGAGRDRAEEHEVTGLELIFIHILADPELFADFARHVHAVLLVDVLHETAAIETADGIDAAVAIRGPAQRQRGA